jgi:hypothetical protein
MRTLGAWVRNNNNQNPQWDLILKKQKDIMDQWSRMHLSFGGKELILKALIQSRALYLATVNRMPKNIQQKMQRQMMNLMWEGKKGLMNWEEASQLREEGGLGLPNIAARVEAIELMWLKKFVSPKTERPTWAIMVDQLIFLNLQKSPRVEEQCRMNWILQSWHES